MVCRSQELENLTGTEADDGEEDISMMVLPDYSSGNNERDIHVKNFNINVGGLELLDCADLKLAYGRKVSFCLCCCSALLGRGGGGRGGEDRGEGREGLSRNKKNINNNRETR